MALATSSTFDVVLGSYSPDAIGLLISQHLKCKGYCTLDLGLDDNLLAEATKSAEHISSNGHLEEPSSILLAGLLGGSGSARVGELELTGTTVPGAASSETMRQLDEQMTNAVAAAYPHLGLDLSSRTATMLHQSGQSEGKDQVNDEEAAKWLTVFVHHRLMAVIFLGPSEGGLEVHPFDEADVPVSTIAGKPGSMVLLRPDLLAHKFSAYEESYCLTCFYSQDARPRKRVCESDNYLTPCAAALQDWAMDRVRSVKESYDEDDPLRPRLPRHWESICNHSGFVAQHIGCHAATVRNPAGWQEDLTLMSAVAGLDAVVEVPISRYCIDDMYEDVPDADAEKMADMATRGKTNCRHGGFLEGLELFDNKLFNISPAESKGMDCAQRQFLECSYESLFKSGFNKKTLMNSRGGVMVTSDMFNIEWNWADKTGTEGGAVCGGGNSINCGRISFCLGMRGPCTALDCGAAGGLVSLSEACNFMTVRGKWEPPPHITCMGGCEQLSNKEMVMWSTASGMYNPVGRCLGFDASSNGMVRSDCFTSATLKQVVQMVDGEPTIDEEKVDQFLGTVASSSMSQCGTRQGVPGVNTPNGANLQELMAVACRNACISPLDVDAVETSSAGWILSDAVECSATTRAFRPDGMYGLEDTPPLGLAAMHNGTGHSMQATGLLNAIRVMCSHKYGITTPTIALRILNPHIDIECCDRPAYINDTILEHPLTSAYTGLTAKSFTGTCVHMLFHGQVDEKLCPPMPSPKFDHGSIAYWPQGGGRLENDSRPRQGYFLAGSWSNFEAEEMQVEEEGSLYGLTVTLGENRWEHFQVWLDGKKERALHPIEMQARKGSKVHGPEASLLFNSWMLDGRPVSMYKTINDIDYSDYAEVETQDTGSVGDKYRVRLRITGKFRTVEWEKLEDKVALADVPKGKYYIIGTWSDLAFQEMVCEDAEKGLFSLEVSLQAWASDFLIVRDQDWMQVFHPALEDVAGPVPMQTTAGAWHLEGTIGDVFKITFERRLDETGQGVQKVSWVKTAEAKADSAERLAELQQPVYYIVGTWDDEAQPMKMHGTDTEYEFFIELGAGETASFRFLKDADRQSCFFPSVADASPADRHTVEGPGKPEDKRNNFWTIGKKEWSGRRDEAAEGKRYRVVLKIEDGSPGAVYWTAPGEGIRVEDAMCRGFYAYGL